MSGAFFAFNAEAPETPTRVVISVDQRGLSDLIGVFWRLINGTRERVELGTEVGFEGLNLSGVLFELAGTSHINFDGHNVTVKADVDRLRHYSDLVEALIGEPKRHQYLDTDSQNVDIELVVSTEEYPETITEKLRSDHRNALC